MPTKYFNYKIGEILTNLNALKCSAKEMIDGSF